MENKSHKKSFLFFVLVFFGFFAVLGFLDFQKGKTLEFGFYAESGKALIIENENVFYCGGGLPSQEFLSRGKVKLFGFFSSDLVISEQNISSKIMCLPGEDPENKTADWWILTENFLPEDASPPSKGILYANGRAATKTVKAYAEQENIPLFDLKTFAYFTLRNGKLSSLEKPN